MISKGYKYIGQREVRGIKTHLIENKNGSNDAKYWDCKRALFDFVSRVDWHLNDFGRLIITKALFKCRQTGELVELPVGKI